MKCIKCKLSFKYYPFFYKFCLFDAAAQFLYNKG